MYSQSNGSFIETHLDLKLSNARLHSNILPITFSSWSNLNKCDLKHAFQIYKAPPQKKNPQISFVWLLEKMARIFVKLQMEKIYCRV